MSESPGPAQAPLGAVFLPDGRPRRPLVLGLLAAFDLLAGLVLPLAVALLELLILGSRVSLAVGPFSSGLCWGAAWRVWTLRPGARGLQTAVCWLGMLAAPPLSTAVFLPALLLTRRPEVGLLLSGKRREQLDADEVSRIAAFVAASDRWTTAMLVALGVAAGAVVALLTVAVGALELAANSVERTRTANEAAALTDLRLLLAAEEAFAALNGGRPDVPACLAAPERCRSAAGARRLPLPQPVEGERAGYARRFHPGLAVDPDEIRRRGLSPSSLAGFAYVVTPLETDGSGGRAFCADATGLIRFNREGTPAVVRDGACPTSWLILYDAKQ